MWNAQAGQYVHVAAPGSSGVPLPAAQATPAAAEPPKPEDVKMKQAEKIVQEMDKWLKSVNQKQPPPPPQKKTPLPDVKIGAVASVFTQDDGDDDETDAELSRTVRPETNRLKMNSFS